MPRGWAHFTSGLPRILNSSSFAALRISTEGSLPLSGITPSERLKLSCQRSILQAVYPWGLGYWAKWLQLLPRRLNNSSMTQVEGGVNIVLSLCCHFAVVLLSLLSESYET